MRKLYILLSFLCTLPVAQAQFGIGLTFGLDLYQRYQNPEDNTGASLSNGNALLNFALGPKIWVGGEKMTFSVEGAANLGTLGLALKDYKGLGAVSFPLMAKLNFNGLSSMNTEGQLGLSIGAGIAYNRTEIYGLTAEYEELGVERDYFQTIIIQVGYGFGITGFTGHPFIRYGFDPDSDANSLNIGIQLDFNLITMRKINDPKSML